MEEQTDQLRVAENDQDGAEYITGVTEPERSMEQASQK